MAIDVKATRSELIETRKKITLSEKGYKILKMKRDSLILEFFNVLGRAKDIRSQLVADYITASKKLALASAIEGEVAINSAAFALHEKPKVEVDPRNVMGVVVPSVSGSASVKSIEKRGYGTLGISPHIDMAAESYEKLLVHIIEAAEIETTLRRLLEDIDKTKRRVNALEIRLIPELKDIAAMIRLRLEELERENIFRLKRIKG